MLNSEVGAIHVTDGRTLIVTHMGVTGHAVFGPYRMLDAGGYVAGFTLAPVDMAGCDDDDVLATIDVCQNSGQEIVASLPIKAGELMAGQRHFSLSFEIKKRGRTEFRVGVNGKAVLEIDGFVPHVSNNLENNQAALNFPDVALNQPAILRDHRHRIRSMYEKGYAVTISGDGLILSRDGISFNVRCLDDLNLVDEIFEERVYQFMTGQRSVVIDIGMNIGLVSMQFAAMPNVERVYSFDPFVSTYERAIANFRLNPQLAAKIDASNSGIGVTSGEIILNIEDSEVSGSRSTRETASGIPQKLLMQRASDALARISAAHSGCAIIVKIDCEGAEYEILDCLAKDGILGAISAIMVEWHVIDSDRDQQNLIAPLTDAGFLTFDRSPPSGNGMFYAVRLAATS